MKTGTYKKAWLCFKTTNNDTDTIELREASFTSHPSGVTEIVHYKNNERLPDNKITLIIPNENLIAFTAYGYAV